MSGKVFFYGLFMDVEILREHGIEAREVRPGRLAGYRLVIGERATLVADALGVVEGLLMSVPSNQLQRLYSQPSVSDYVAESVSVSVERGEVVEAACYNLPKREHYGAQNDAYARQLVALARRIGLSDRYVDSIIADAQLDE